MAWVSHGRPDTGVGDDEELGFHPAYGRERYFGALSAYAIFKEKTKVKKEKVGDCLVPLCSALDDPDGRTGH